MARQRELQAAADASAVDCGDDGFRARLVDGGGLNRVDGHALEPPRVEDEGRLLQVLPRRDPEARLEEQAAADARRRK